jgi:predicted DNA-binding transcriptional regulator AlpA
MDSIPVLLRISDICQRLRISRRKFERIREGKVPVRLEDGSLADKFPTPTIVMGGRYPRWSSDDLNNWINI